MKILLINKFFYLKGGSETVYFQEREYLKDKGDYVIDFSMEGIDNLPSDFSNYFVPEIQFNNHCNIWAQIRKSVSFIHSFTAINKLRQLLENEKPQIAHLHNIYHQLTPSIIPLLKARGVKIILTLHDYKLICPSYIALNKGDLCNACSCGDFTQPLKRNCQNSRTRELLFSAEALFHKWRKSYDNVDVFISPSDFMADIISKRIPKRKIQVLHNGVDLNKFKPNYSDAGYCLYLGRLSKEKGIETLLNAYEHSNLPLSLKIVGSGPLTKELMKNYSNVEFTGYQTGKSLTKLISKSAFVIVPSEWYENCSMTVLESMALGKPVIGSRIGGIPEQIENERTGFLFEMGNVDELSEKMQILAFDSELRRNMGIAARDKIVHKYSLNKHTKKLYNIYSSLT